MEGIGKFSVAPMMGLTDRHCRYFHRKLSSNTLLYTEMIAAKAILHGDRRTLLRFDPVEKPLALQVGGSNPLELAEVSKIAEELGFDEINLNVGCPSSKVKSGRFGAVLMRDPPLVAKCVEAMKTSTKFIKVSVKCRIGLDEQIPSLTLPNFISTVIDGGVDYFIVHARKAILSGLSPKANREIPPLDYSIVKSIKNEFPNINIFLNGGISSINVARALLNDCYDGVMLGRASYYHPSTVLSKVDSEIYGDSEPKNMFKTVYSLLPYIEKELQLGTRLNQITRHLTRAFMGLKGAKEYRRYLSENSFKSGADATVLLNALSKIENM